MFRGLHGIPSTYYDNISGKMLHLFSKKILPVRLTYVLRFMRKNHFASGTKMPPLKGEVPPQAAEG